MIVADNLCNSRVETLERVKQITNKEIIFYQIDVTNEVAVDTVFVNHWIDGISAPGMGADYRVKVPNGEGSSSRPLLLNET